jgi:hypothetical protein
VKRQHVGFVRNAVGGRHDIYRDTPGRSAKVNATLPLRQGKIPWQKSYFTATEDFNLFFSMVYAN